MSVSPGSLAGRLSTALTLLVALVVVVGLTGAAALGAVSSRVTLIGTRVTPAVESTDAVLQAVTDAEASVLGHLLAADPALRGRFEASRQRAESQLAAVRRLTGDDPAVAPLLREHEAAVTAWFTGYAEPVVREEVPTDAGTTAPGAALMAEVRRTNGELGQVLRDRRTELRSATAVLRAAGGWGVLALTVLAAAIGVLVAVRTVRWTAFPTARLGEVVERLRMGELGARADMDDGPEEVLSVARAVNTLADESERRRDEEQEAARLREAAGDVARAVRAELDRAAALHAAVDGLGTVLGVDVAWVRLVGGPGELGELAAVWTVDDAVPLARPTGEAVDLEQARRLWRTRQVLHVDNTVRSALRGYPHGHRLVEETGAAAVVCAPLGVGDDVLGVLTVLSTSRTRHFSQPETDAVQVVAGELARALEHAALFEHQLRIVERLQELDRQKTDFMSTVSHELRTPLTSIAGYAELLCDGDAGPVTPAMASMLEVVQRNTVRLRSLIEDLLTLSRIESGTYRSEAAVLVVADLVCSVELTVRPQADQAGVDLAVDAGPRGLAVHGDEMQLERVLLNVLSNAVKFTPAGGRVRLAVGADAEGWVTLTCADTGIGIPLAEQEHVFGRFFRASNATAQAIPGTGLGLVIVQGIVERHGGVLELDSAEGEGTTVVVRLPPVPVGTPGRASALSPSVSPLAH